MFDYERCIHCGSCAEICPVHSMENGRHTLDFEKNCTLCGKCVNVCPAHALEIKGYEASVQEIVADVKQDNAYYLASGGGVTISGGEPMLQFEFTKELLESLKANQIHTAVETCGFADTEKYLQILPYTDLFLWDYKVTENHTFYTGVEQYLILSNLEILIQHGGKVILRCPIIPTVNDNEIHFRAISELSRKYPLVGVNILPYHNMGIYKSQKLGVEPWDLNLKSVSEDVKKQYDALLTEYGCVNYWIL